MDNRPIGVFDSGVGGLTVVSALQKKLPGEKIIYLGDTARIPYGTRSPETVRIFALECASFLKSNNVKCIVIACNTASAHAYYFLKKKFKLPIFEVITPASIKAVELTKTGNIAIMATSGTVRSRAYTSVIQHLDKNTKVNQIACPLLVPLIEEGEIKGKLINILINRYLKQLNPKADVVILGCTHYPLIQDQISKKLGAKIVIINSASEVAKLVKTYLENNNLLSSTTPFHQFYVTDISESFKDSADRFLGGGVGKKIRKAELL